MKTSGRSSVSQVFLGLGFGLAGLATSSIAVEVVRAVGVDIETEREKFVLEQLKELERRSGGFSSEDLDEIYRRAPVAVTPSETEFASAAKVKARPWSIITWMVLGALLVRLGKIALASATASLLVVTALGYPVIDAALGWVALTIGWTLWSLVTSVQKPAETYSGD